MRITSRVFAVAVAATILVACGGDDGDTSPTSAVPSDVGTDASNGSNELDFAGDVDDSDLIVPRDYLQGEWCDSDGQTWTIEGDTATFEDGSGGAGALPVDIAFIDNLDVELVSRTDDMFVVGPEGGGGETQTFTRGRC